MTVADEGAAWLHHLASRGPLSTPVLTQLPPGYSNWQTEADLCDTIERLRGQRDRLRQQVRDDWGNDDPFTESHAEFLQAGDMTEDD